MGKSDVVLDLFAEFVDAHNSGSRPSVDDHVSRAGVGGEELRKMIDCFLEARSEADAASARILERVYGVMAQQTADIGEERVPFGSLIAEREEVLRQERKCHRVEILRRIATSAGVPESGWRKFGIHYHRLKTGRLDPRGVTSGLLGALSAELSIGIARLISAAASYETETPTPSLQFTRADVGSASVELGRGTGMVAGDMDMVDRMFMGDAPDEG